MISSQRCDGPCRALPTSGVRLRRQRLPSRLEMPERRLVNRIVDPMTVPLERLAGAHGLAAGLLDPLRLGIECVAFLPDDLVDALVLAAQLLDQPSELLRDPTWSAPRA